MSESFFEISYYHDYISPTQARHLISRGKAVHEIEGLLFTSGRPQINNSLETIDGLNFLTHLYIQTKSDLNHVLKQRIVDRQFIDDRVRACFEFNQTYGRDFLDKNYKTILGLQDSKGRTVIGPLTQNYCNKGGTKVAPIPEHLSGPHVTLFGPPDSAKMAINAMNAFHRKLKDEPAIVEELLATNTSFPKWGADDEDSKTPLHSDLAEAGANLTSCFEGHLSLIEGEKKYTLAQDHLSLPIKRFPGLALPSTFLFYKNNPIPLHLYDFALHLFKNWHNPKALCFYVPKLENEEEAHYVHKMVSTAEAMIKKLHPEYVLGTVRLMIVLENPRAILRTHEIMDALHPYFVGASLGWHDYLGSTARIFKEDGNYRIPVKADPNIVIKYIKASHLLLADVVGSRGGIKVGGMYGILPMRSEITDPSFQVTLKGFFKDVITQLKRNLTGFWVAHPDFVRIGLATVEAWKFYTEGEKNPLHRLVSEFLLEPHRTEVLSFIAAKDIEGLDKQDPHYVRSLLVADIKESDYIANNHPDEIRYNVFQSLQYLTDWLSGNGCVALPATLNDISVRVMDDLATAERSRWEVWHELYHGRFDLAEFIKIAHEELHFIRKDLSHPKKIVQVKWDDRTQKWYPIALSIMLQLMTSKNPPEFATELLLPFTIDEIRSSPDPWTMAKRLNPNKYVLEEKTEKLNYYFEKCGCLKFAKLMSANAILDSETAKQIILNFTVAEINEAASFHGNIGESRAHLDAMAAQEQAQVHQDQTANELLSLGKKYVEQFGFKYLVSAKGKSGLELLNELKTRLLNSKETEIENAQKALFEITQKRFLDSSLDSTFFKLSEVFKSHNLPGGISIALSTPKPGIQKKCSNYELTFSDFDLQSIVMGQSDTSNAINPSTLFEIASLSKTIAAAFAYEFFSSKNIDLNTSVNSLLTKAKSPFRITCSVDESWSDQVTLAHLIRHQALNLHYVNGFHSTKPAPTALEILMSPSDYGYQAIDVLNKPGTVFKYSGGGFLVLEHLIESLEKAPIHELTSAFLKTLSLNETIFPGDQLEPNKIAQGFFDNQQPVPGRYLSFPSFAAGAISTPTDMQKFLMHMTVAYHNLDGSSKLQHNTAAQMIFGEDKGAKDFMGALAGSGVFIAEAGDNKIILHQGANEGFRALYLHCISGPDCGKGFTICSNGDNKAVLLIAEIAQVLLKHLKFSGINFDQFQKTFDFSIIPQEQIVNLGYKELIFNNFQPTLAVEISNKGAIDELAPYNLAIGGKIVQVTNQRFARAENLLSPNDPTFDPDLFCSQGKVMDSWETARHNLNSFDSLIFETQHPISINYVSFSTKYHDGNQAQFVALWGRLDVQTEWEEVIPKTQMQGHALLQINLMNLRGPFQQFKVDLFPDGGLSRIGLFLNLPADRQPQFKRISEAQCIRFGETIPKSHKPLTISYDEPLQLPNPKYQIDWASRAYGGQITMATNEHYGPAIQVISPFRPLHMFDGLESARSRKPGHFEEVIIELAKPVSIDEIIFDFTYFVNNNPHSIKIEALLENKWIALSSEIFCKPFAGNKMKFKNAVPGIFSHIKIQTIPDGGINRIHVYGSPPA